MSFYILFKEEGQNKRESFSSYYQFISRKNELRKQSIDFTVSMDGGDVEKKDIKAKISQKEKETLKNFLGKIKTFNIKQARDKERYEAGKL